MQSLSDQPFDVEDLVEAHVFAAVMDNQQVYCSSPSGQQQRDVLAAALTSAVWQAEVTASEAKADKEQAIENASRLHTEHCAAQELQADAVARYALGEDLIDLFERLRKQAGWIEQMMMPTVKIIMRQTLEAGDRQGVQSHHSPGGPCMC
ncbi:hypothetical protein WJX82_007620 [Trebouxia sp. C0006]